MGYGERFWHFNDATLPPEWASVVGGNASVFMYDGGVKLDSGSGTAGDTAAIYQAFDRSRGNYQRITVCLRSSGTNFRPQVALTYRVGGPIADTAANVNATLLCRTYTYQNAGLYYGSIGYWNTAGTANSWSDASKAFGTTSAGATPQISESDDYHIVGIDWDDVLDRVRLFWVHVAAGTTFANEAAGPKLFALTDWVDLSSIRNGGQTSDLYLVIGWLYNSVNLVGETQHIEWVRHEWADALIPSFANQKLYNNGSGYNLKCHTSLRADGVKLPISRTGVALDLVAATWESDSIGQFGSVVRDPVADTYWMSYSAANGSTGGIGVASATDPLGTWTKYGSNPVLADETSQHYAGKNQNCLVLDHTEPDPAKRWKLLVTCYSDLDAHMRVYLYNAAQPDTTAWTREGLLLDWDTGNLDGDLGPQLYAPPVYLNGRWYLHYVGLNNTPPWLNYVAVGDRLAAGAFSKVRTTNFLDAADGVEMTISSGSGTSRIVTVNSTSGVAADDFVMYDQDSTTSNWQLGRVRTVLSSTQLELYHRIPGLSTSGVLRTVSKGKLYAHHLLPFGDEWLWVATLFGTMFGHATFASSYEGAGLFRGANPPHQQKPSYDRVNTPGWWLSRDNSTGSTENPRLIGGPVHPFTQSLTVRRRRRQTHLRR